VISYDLTTGAIRGEVPLPQGQMVIGPFARGELFFLSGQDRNLKAYRGFDGKPAWQYQLSAPTARLHAGGELVIAVAQNLEVVALDLQGKLKWKAQRQGNGCAGALSDGEDVFVAAVQRDRSLLLTAFNSSGGKMRWEANVSPGERMMGLALSEAALGREHLLVRQNVPDPKRGTAPSIVLLNRRNGKVTWAGNVASTRGASAALFDGGAAVCQGPKLTGYLSGDAQLGGASVETLEQQVARNPRDAKLRLRLANALRDAGRPVQAVAALAAALEQELEPADFAQVCDRLAKCRKAAAEKVKREIRFVRLNKAPALSGDPGAWPASGLKLDSWKDLFLAAEMDARLPFKKEHWTGPEDLSVAFHGGWDDRNLYVALLVQDNTHSNPQTEAQQLWDGDSLQVAFDQEQNTKMSFSEKGCEFGAALNDQGATLAFRWVQGGKYLMKPLETPVKITRQEKRRTTFYELALPLADLGLEAKAGTRFGFTFIVNDRDGGEGVQKGMGASPGVWNPKSPALYAAGVLSEKP
jgi:hypothetical protein